MMTKTKQQENFNRKKVLLIGNGPFEQSSKHSWERVIAKFVAGSKEKNDENNSIDNIPKQLLALFIEDYKKTKLTERVAFAFEGYEYSYIKQLKDYIEYEKFDAILTMNYTYDIENHFFDIDNYHELSKTRMMNNYVFTTDGPNVKREGNYYLKRYNRVNGKDVWHIHGELCNPSSMILTQTNYSTLYKKVREYFYKSKNKNVDINEIEYKSWIDYLLYGDVTIFGTSLDYSEIDLWLLLSIRRHLKNRGDIVFYTKEDKVNVDFLESIDVKTDKEFENYKAFYDYVMNKKPRRRK